MHEQYRGKAASAVLGRDADGRKMCRTVMIYHYEREPDHSVRGVDNPVAYGSGFVKQKCESVLRIIFAIAKAAKVEPQNLFQLFAGKRPHGIRRRCRRVRSIPERPPAAGQKSF